ncbi:protein disulfide isomerase-like 1-6 isoform X2 [Magnolia sinica]|uniref:protein disulfide isomerase-like 1-6 isoform X2 n=1 Tax=Magnolia sinica TaxID=86752 RepID=UPI0026598F41|nr:protein disulfide isomerase-like 1-6 isoform X2 [Magnolia sinica]
MPSARPTSILIPFILALLLFLSTTAPHHAMHDGHDDDDDDDADMDGLEELLAVDKEVEEEGEEQEEGQKWKSSEAEVLSRAQRIVLQLTNENARQVIDGNDYVLLLGFAPWCHRSAEMMPHFAGAAAALKEMGSPVLLAKLDAERYPKAAGMLGIKGFPTLQLFVNGSAQLYTGGFSGEEIVIWTRKKTGNPVIRLSSVTEAEKFLEKHRIFAIGLFENFEVYIFAVADDFKNLLVMLQDVARKFKTKIMFVYADTADDDLAKPFLTLFGLDSEKPIVTAFDYTTGSKYLLESEPTSSNLEEFCSGLLHGTLSPYYRSDPISDTKGIVQAVVGRSFDAVVLNSPENVLLEVYTPWCMTCEKMSKEIEKLATHFKGVDNLLFARIDASSNEHPKLQINDFPTVLFYPSGNKSNPIKVSAKSSLKDLIAFINANVKAKGKISTSEQTVKDEL